MINDRFDYATNRRFAGSYRGYRDAIWPPSDNIRVASLGLDTENGDLRQQLRDELNDLRDAMETQWHIAVEKGTQVRQGRADPGTVAATLHRIADRLPDEVDRRALRLRARAVEHGYDDGMLEALAGLDEDIAVVAGRIATWYGKQPGRMPTAFASRRDRHQQEVVKQARQMLEDAAAYVGTLNLHLRLSHVPAFTAGQLFFMAGEGDRHPKHIAYFLPEDEGVKRSAYKKTYYFVNTHHALLEHQSVPLADRFLDIGATLRLNSTRFGNLPTLGVYGHEVGHSVQRDRTNFKEINATDRWASIVLQEVAADVFGILVTGEVWADRMNVRLDDVLGYYLAECLRYLNRGLGYFPDSDGMFLQLNYLVRLGALRVERAGGDPRLTGDPATVLAALRSLARVLADALLAGSAQAALALHDAFGPVSGDELRPLIDAMRMLPAASVEYVQEMSAPASISTRSGDK